jgi:hypothetical protein
LDCFWNYIWSLKIIVFISTVNFEHIKINMVSLNLVWYASPTRILTKNNLPTCSFGFNAKETCSTWRGKAKDTYEMGIKEEKFTRVKPYSSCLIIVLLPL